MTMFGCINLNIYFSSLVSRPSKESTCSYIETCFSISKAYLFEWLLISEKRNR